MGRLKTLIPQSILMALLMLFLLYLIQQSSARYYWHDEVSNLLYLSGNVPEVLNQKLADNQPKKQAEIQQFQAVNPEKKLSDTIQSVALSSGQPPPLYLILLWGWSRIFGNAEWVLRSLSTLIWLGFLAIVYRLSILLFTNQRTAIIAVLLIAFSPRFLPLAFQVWEFGLYALFTVLSSLLFLSAFNNSPSLKRWLYYSLSLTAGLYTQLFFVTVPLSHFAYWICNWRSGSQKQKIYGLSSIILSMLLFCPWLFFVRLNPSKIYAWAAGRWVLSTYLSRWWETVTGIFVTLHLPLKLDYGVMLGIIILLGWTVLSLLLGTNRQVSSFLLSLIVVPLSVLLLWDVLFGMKYASVGRFFLPTLMGLVLALAYWINGLMISSRPVLRGLGYLALTSVLILEILSVLPTGSSQAKYQGYGSEIVNGMAIVNQAEKPLVISEKWLDLLSVSHAGKAETLYILLKTPEQFQNLTLSNQALTIYLVAPSASLLNEVQQAGYQIRATKSEEFWQIQIRDLWNRRKISVRGDRGFA